MRSKLLKSTLLALTLCSGLAHAISASGGAPAASLCTGQGYSTLFFNGVGNTHDDAQSTLDLMRESLPAEHNAEPVGYELMYNTTKGTIKDVIETLRQRDQEAGRAWSVNFEQYWLKINGQQLSAFEKDERFKEYLKGVQEAYTTSLKGAATAAFRNASPTTENLSEQFRTTRELIERGQKVLMVGHSQGNLFMNTTFAGMNVLGYGSSVNRVHVAPAATAGGSLYLLADIDLVIKGLNLIDGSNSSGQYTPNVDLPFSFSDVLGHGMKETYLDPDRAALARIKSLVATGFDSLQQASGIKVNQGFFTATLLWDGSGDVDLHVIEPNQAHVFFGSRKGSSGELDLDNTVANGPEHYFASCNPAAIQVGDYTVGVANYRGATGRKASLQVSSAKGGVLIDLPKFDVGPETINGQDFTAKVVLSVTKDSEGQFKVSAR